MVMVRSVVGARAEVAGLGIPRMKEAENQDRIECGDLNTTVAHRSFNTDDLRGRGEGATTCPGKRVKAGISARRSDTAASFSSYKSHDRHVLT